MEVAAMQARTMTTRPRTVFSPGGHINGDRLRIIRIARRDMADRDLRQRSVCRLAALALSTLTTLVATLALTLLALGDLSVLLAALALTLALTLALIALVAALSLPLALTLALPLTLALVAALSLPLALALALTLALVALITLALALTLALVYRCAEQVEIAPGDEQDANCQDHNHSGN